MIIIIIELLMLRITKYYCLVHTIIMMSFRWNKITWKNNLLFFASLFTRENVDERINIGVTHQYYNEGWADEMILDKLKGLRMDNIFYSDVFFYGLTHSVDDDKIFN